MIHELALVGKAEFANQRKESGEGRLRQGPACLKEETHKYLETGSAGIDMPNQGI